MMSYFVMSCCDVMYFDAILVMSLCLAMSCLVVSYDIILMLSCDDMCLLMLFL